MDKFLARVVGVHPESGTVDVEALRTGWQMKGVMVLSGPSTPRVGVFGLPEFGADEYGVALVEIIDGVPLVSGFLPARTAESRFADGRMVFRHDSDCYISLGRDGEFEFYHPSGAMLRIGEQTAHENLTGQDVDGEWALTKNAGKDVSITLSVGQSRIRIADDGIVIDTPSLDINEA